MFIKFYLILSTCLFSLCNCAFTIYSQSVTNDNIANITYGQNTKKLLYTDFSIRVKTPGWISIGFTDTPEKMIISRCIIGWFENSTPKVKSYYINSYLSDDIVDNEIKNDYFGRNISITYIDSILELNFTKQMGKFNAIIPIIWASHSYIPLDGYWDLHDSYGSSLLDLSKGVTDNNFVDISISPLYVINMLFSFIVIITSLISVSSSNIFNNSFIIKYINRKILISSWLIELRLYELLFTGFVLILLVIFTICAYFGVIPFYNLNFAQTIGYMVLFFFIIITIPITKTSLVLKIFNTSFEQAVKHHRWIGHLLLIFTIIHLCAVIYKYGLNYIISSKEVGDQNIIPLFGTIAFISTCILYIFSLSYVRRNHYNLFKNIHWIFIFIFISIILHYKPSGYFFIPSFLLYITSLIIRINSRFHKVSINTISKIENVTILEILDSTAHLYIRNGSYVFLCIPEISNFEWHPFSISWFDNNSYTLHVKSSGDWSKKLYNIDTVSFMYVDKFYGRFEIDPMRYKTSIFVAGGIGITPFINTLTQIMNTNSTHENIILIWITKTNKDVSIFKKKLDDIEKNVNNVIVKIFITNESYSVKPDIKSILDNIFISLNHVDIGMFACGPERLTKEVQSVAISKDCDFHKEIFSL